VKLSSQNIGLAIGKKPMVRKIASRANANCELKEVRAQLKNASNSL